MCLLRRPTPHKHKNRLLAGSLFRTLIRVALGAAAGPRHYNFDEYFKGSVSSSFGCFEAGAPAGGCTAGANNLDKRGFGSQEARFQSRANLTYHIKPHIIA